MVGIRPLFLRFVSQINELFDDGGKVSWSWKLDLCLGVSIHHHKSIETNCLDLLWIPTQREAMTHYIRAHHREFEFSSKAKSRDAFIIVIVEHNVADCHDGLLITIERILVEVMKWSWVCYDTIWTSKINRYRKI